MSLLNNDIIAIVLFSIGYFLILILGSRPRLIRDESELYGFKVFETRYRGYTEIVDKVKYQKYIDKCFKGEI